MMGMFGVRVQQDACDCLGDPYLFRHKVVAEVGKAATQSDRNIRSASEVLLDVVASALNGTIVLLLLLLVVVMVNNGAVN